MSEVLLISYTPADAIGEHKIVWEDESESLYVLAQSLKNCTLHLKSYEHIPAELMKYLLILTQKFVINYVYI